MGNTAVQDFGKHNKPIKTLIVGLDNSGKTVLLYKLKTNELITSVPSVGFNTETVKYKEVLFEMSDLGRFTDMYHHYYADTQFVIFVIDSNDKDRICDAKDILHKMFAEDTLKYAKFLIFANKQDLKNAVSVQEITDKLDVNNISNRMWKVIGCSVITGDGLHNGLDWLLVLPKEEYDIKQSEPKQIDTVDNKETIQEVDEQKQNNDIKDVKVKHHNESNEKINNGLKTSEQDNDSNKENGRNANNV
eukprot:405208_1